MLTLGDIKPHLNIFEPTDTEEDVLIEGYLSAAKAAIASFVRKDLDAVYGPDFPEDLLQAQRMLTAHYYLHREAEVGMPPGVKDLLECFKSFA